jgi:hypothetical protein
MKMENGVTGMNDGVKSALGSFLREGTDDGLKS